MQPVSEAFDTPALLAMAAQHAAPLYGAPDVILARGSGVYLYDLQQRRYLDFAGGMGVHILGHGHPEVVAAVVAQASTLMHTSNAYLTAGPIALAARLAKLCGDYQSFFVNSGTEAIEGALKLARAYAYKQGRARPRFIACHKGFHGRTLGALSVTGQPKLQKGFQPLLAEVSFVDYDDVDALQAAMGDDVAAVLLEPVQGNGGVRVPKDGYLAAVRHLCDQHGALMVVDEVQTGIGRCGEWLASHASGVTPDIVCLAKALGGGLPLAAVMARPQVMAAFARGSHGSTFGGNPVSCAAALATLQVMERDNLLAHARHIGALLQQLCAELPHVQEVRGRGLLLGLQLAAPLQLAKVREDCLHAGLLTTAAGADVLRLFLPAIVTEAHVHEAHQILRQVLAEQ